MELTQEEKQLLLRDLCARLPYGVIARFCDGVKEGIDDVWDIDMFSGAINADYIIDDVKPYLRPMSSMTKEEKKEFDEVIKSCNNKVFACPEQERRYIFFDAEQEDFMNAHHFDYRGLIPMGLALEAPEGMYNSTNNT